jgi:hypothetical protein
MSVCDSGTAQRTLEGLHMSLLEHQVNVLNEHKDPEQELRRASSTTRPKPDNTSADGFFNHQKARDWLESVPADEVARVGWEAMPEVYYLFRLLGLWAPPDSNWFVRVLFPYAIGGQSRSCSAVSVRVCNGFDSF